MECPVWNKRDTIYCSSHGYRKRWPKNITTQCIITTKWWKTWEKPYTNLSDQHFILGPTLLSTYRPMTSCGLLNSVDLWIYKFAFFSPAPQGDRRCELWCSNAGYQTRSPNHTIIPYRHQDHHHRAGTTIGQWNCQADQQRKRKMNCCLNVWYYDKRYFKGCK